MAGVSSIMAADKDWDRETEAGEKRRTNAANPEDSHTGGFGSRYGKTSRKKDEKEFSTRKKRRCLRGSRRREGGG